MKMFFLLRFLINTQLLGCALYYYYYGCCPKEAEGNIILTPKIQLTEKKNSNEYLLIWTNKVQHKFVKKLLKFLLLRAWSKIIEIMSHPLQGESRAVINPS
jgi:hypothetical protein